MVFLLISGPKGIAVNRSGHVVVVDNKASCILVFQPNGKLVQRFGSRGSEASKFAGPHFVAINSQDHIIISDFHNHSIKVRIIELPATSWMLTGDCQKLSFSTLIKVPFLIFWSEKPHRRSSSVQLACSTKRSRQARQSLSVEGHCPNLKFFKFFGKTNLLQAQDLPS